MFKSMVTENEHNVKNFSYMSSISHKCLQKCVYEDVSALDGHLRCIESIVCQEFVHDTFKGPLLYPCPDCIFNASSPA